jgi:insertion element IS1 protein InsB
VWLAFDRSKYAMVDFVVGSRSGTTGKQLWEKVSDLGCKQFCTDECPAYSEFLDKDKHVISKQGTTQIESYNSNIGHYLARFRRKTKCYSKKARMVCLSLYLLMYKDLISSIF